MDKQSWESTAARRARIRGCLLGTETLLLSVNHSGDSDSTGAICGSLLGVRYSDVQLPASWLVLTEGRGVIAELADDLSLQTEHATVGYGEPVHPYDRYPHN